MMKKSITGLMILLMVCWQTAEAGIRSVVAAAKSGDLEYVRRALSENPGLIHSVDASGYTALHWAGIRAHWDIFELLLAYDPDVNAVGADGGTPVHWACHHDRPDMVRLLLDREGDLHIQNRWGRTPLHTAVRRGCRDVAILLLESGASLDTVTHEGWTPLHVGYLSGHEGMIELLISRGASLQAADKEGKTPPQLRFERPPPAPGRSPKYQEYVGEYFVDKDFAFKVWVEQGCLLFLDFAVDELYPVSPDVFFCKQEPWQVSFIRDERDRVVKIKVRFLRRTVMGTKRRR